jgi:branched-chain amino acid transport system ATP-binding protein
MLEVRGLSKEYGGFQAVRALSFTVPEGSATGLVGPNGAGKTTTFNIISGFERPTRGRVLFRGEDVTGLRPHVLARKGLVRTFQNTRVFSRLTVEDNIAIGCSLSLRPEEQVEAILDMVGLAAQRSRTAGELPYGQQRLLGIGIALGARPRLLLLDEPFAGMNPAEAAECMELIHRIRRAGTTILLIDHHMETVMRHCDRIIVLHHGEKLAEGTPAEVRADARVVETYLGEAHA